MGKTNMLYLCCVIFRKIQNCENRLLSKIRVFYYYHISKHNFIINNNVIFSKGFCIESDISLTKILINAHCRFRAHCNIVMGQGGKLTIGENCFFNNNCSVNCFSEIYIGNNNQFGEGVKMYDHNHNFREKSKLINEQGYSLGKIKIGDNCWFGSNVVILKG